MSDFAAVNDSALVALADALARQPLSPGKLAFAWRAAVGARMAKATELRLGAEGVLHVHAASRHWRLEVERARPLIAARLARLLGPGAVRSIDIQAP